MLAEDRVQLFREPVVPRLQCYEVCSHQMAVMMWSHVSLAMYLSVQVSDQLTGFRHNAVSPVGLATPLPIILSDRVAALQPPVFWLGGGEADLKVCLPVERFVEAYGATVVDCTDDKRTMAE